MINFGLISLPRNHIQIIEFKGKITINRTLLRVPAIWTPMIKSLSFWRLRGGSGRPRGGSREAPGRLWGGSGRLWEARREFRRLWGGSRRLRGGFGRPSWRRLGGPGDRVWGVLGASWRLMRPSQRVLALWNEATESIPSCVSFFDCFLSDVVPYKSLKNH